MSATIIRCCAAALLFGVAHGPVRAEPVQPPPPGGEIPIGTEAFAAPASDATAEMPEPAETAIQRPASLRVISWDLADSPHALMPKPKSPLMRPAWRTTFGSERQNKPPDPTAAKPGDIEADVVLLQGVTDVRALRRIFPARTWRIVVPRQSLGTGADPLAARPTSPTGAAPAVAVRFRSGMRVTGREQMVLPGTGDGQSDRLAIAVRLLSPHGPTWVASWPGCGSDAACQGRERIAAWEGEKQKLGEATIVGGKQAAASAESPCQNQVIEVRTNSSDNRQRVGGREDPANGCQAELTLATH